MQKSGKRQGILKWTINGNPASKTFSVDFNWNRLTEAVLMLSHKGKTSACCNIDVGMIFLPLL